MGMTQQHTPTRIRSARRAAATLLAVGALGIVAVACGDDDSESKETSAPTTEAVASGEVTIEGAWARTSPMDAANGAAYMTITSPADDKLVGIKGDASLAATFELHETVMADATDTTMDMGSETTMGMGSETTMGMGGSDTTMAMGGEMTMRPVEFMELKAGTPFELKPGGFHIMLIGLVSPLEVGQTIQLTLVFEKAGEMTVDVPVLDEAP